MPVFYFHLQNGSTKIDHEGIELPDLSAARDEAAGTIAAILREDDMNSLWHGESLRLWVTEASHDGAPPLLELRISAAAAK